MLQVLPVQDPPGQSGFRKQARPLRVPPVQVPLQSPSQASPRESTTWLVIGSSRSELIWVGLAVSTQLSFLSVMPSPSASVLLSHAMPRVDWPEVACVGLYTSGQLSTSLATPSK